MVPPAAAWAPEVGRLPPHGLCVVAVPGAVRSEVDVDSVRHVLPTANHALQAAWWRGPEVALFMISVAIDRDLELSLIKRRAARQA